MWPGRDLRQPSFQNSLAPPQFRLQSGEHSMAILRLPRLGHIDTSIFLSGHPCHFDEPPRDRSLKNNCSASSAAWTPSTQFPALFDAEWKDVGGLGDRGHLRLGGLDYAGDRRNRVLWNGAEMLFNRTGHVSLSKTAVCLRYSPRRKVLESRAVLTRRRCSRY